MAGASRDRRQGRRLEPAEARRRLWWLFPALLALAAALVLWLGWSTDCLPLDGPGGSAGQVLVCSSSLSPGAVVVAVIFLLTAVVVAVAGRPRR